jgi:hypothetical protein
MRLPRLLLVLSAVVLIAGCGSGNTPTGASPTIGAPPTSGTSNSPRTGGPVPASPSPSIVAAGGQSVALGGAQLRLPAGWTAEFLQPTANSRTIVPTWCLSSAPLPSPVYVGQVCAATFSQVLPQSKLSVDTEGGIESNPQYCGPGFQGTGSLLSYADSKLGDRPADYRRWLFSCNHGKRWQVEQYVADNAPGFILFSAYADAATHAALMSIAQSAVLPAMSGPLRLSDLGIVRTMTPLAGGGYHITVDRVVRGMKGLINNNPATYPYDVGPANYAGGAPPRVGALINVFTNGTTVTSYELPPA